MDNSFQLSFTHVRAPPRGSHKRKLKPGHSHPQTYKRMKQSILIIQNKDDLCCTRAIVTAKAKVDQHPNWEGIRKGRTIQTTLALQLHQEADIPQGPCGNKELNKFHRRRVYQPISCFSWMKPEGSASCRSAHPKIRSLSCSTAARIITLSALYLDTSPPVTSVGIV